MWHFFNEFNSPSAAFTSAPSQLNLMEKRLGLTDQAQWLCIGVRKTSAVPLGLFSLPPFSSNNKGEMQFSNSTVFEININQKN